MKKKSIYLFVLNLKQWTLTVFVFLSYCTGVQAQIFSGGTGSPSNPYQIGSIDDLIKLSNVDKAGADTLWNKSYRLISDISFNEDETLVDWNNDGSAIWNLADQKGFAPIGDISSGTRQKVPFTGSFNGAGHYISNIYINRNENYLGLFGFVGMKGRIDSLGIKNVRITAEGGWIYGVLAARVDGSAIGTKATVNQCCAIGGTLNFVNESRAGALIGYTNYVDILNCYSTVNITGSEYLGGLIGYMDFGVNLLNCYSSGKVVNTMESYFAGGLVSSRFGNSAIITNCFWDKETSKQNIAGFSAYTGASGLSSSEFAVQNNFTAAGWDFTNTWKMGTLTEDHYVRPRLKWQALSDTCLCPNGFYAQKINSSSAHLHWTSHSGTVKLVYGLSGSIQNPSGETALQVEGSNYTLSNLEEGRSYDVFLQSVCENGGMSSWAGYTFCLYTNEGLGTYKNPYLVEDTTDLIALSQNPVLWDQCFLQIANIDFNEADSLVDWNGDRVLNDIDKKGFAPIGRINPFLGRYDGNGHVIRNLYQDNNYNSHVGLFCTLNYGAVVENLGLENVDINASYVKTRPSGTLTITTYANSGPIAGRAIECTINNSYASGNLKSNSNGGGLVGIGQGLNLNRSYGSVNTIADYSGGLMGWAYYRVTVEDCYSTGKVTRNTKDTYTAGMVGTYSNSLTFNTSYWDTITSGRGYATNYGSTHTNLNARGLKPADFANTANFVGWDFANTWYISDEVPFDTLARPRLQWQKGPFIVSGKVRGIDEVKMILTDKNTGQQIGKTALGGDYAFSVKYRQSIIIKPVKAGCVFSPDSIIVDPVSDNLFNQDFNVVDNTLSSAVFSSGTNQCIDAQNSISLAGNGDSVVFKSGSSANLIAGQTIRFLPGFKAEAGSFLNASITTNGTFCSGNGAVQVILPLAEKGISVKNSQTIKSDCLSAKPIKIYPNPNNGLFAIEIDPTKFGEAIEIFNMLGSRVFQSALKDESRQNINIQGESSGVYILKIKGKQGQSSARIIIR